MGVDPALAAYEAFAAAYNDFNHSNDYEMWLGRSLLPELREHGLREGGIALDVGCGTGRAFRPLLRRGWQAAACDISPAMLEVAAQEGGDAVALHIADMRELPTLGEFDLVLSLNDSVNYLLGDGDLVRALAGMEANLAENGLLVFDVNSSSTFASGYEEIREVEHEGSRWVWTGKGEVAPSVFEAEITGDRLDKPIRQIERFRPQREVLEAMRSAGLRTVAARGMSEAGGEILLSETPDESRDYKLVFVGAKVNGDRSGRRSPSPIADVDRPPFIWGS
jgi:SAM-dependent methyltransferase